MNRHILVFEHDLLKYPPILSVINFLLDQKAEVIFIGSCSDHAFVKDFTERGGQFFQVIENDIGSNSFKKLIRYLSFKNQARSIIRKLSGTDTRVWLFGEQCAWLLHDAVRFQEYVIYLFEIPSFRVSNRYRLLCPTLDYKSLLQKAYRVICCEYNRAHITKSFFHLKRLPLVVPNKLLLSDIKSNVSIDQTLLEKLKGKKMILYQGVFNFPERRLDEFCESINGLPSEFIFCLMGGDNIYKNKLIKKYASDRILFLPYMAAPNHLEITKLAYIGVLVYNSIGSNIENTLNTLYCAPNKIFEYAKFGIPMIANDLPALDSTFNFYKSGLLFKEFTPRNITDVILSLHNDYQAYSVGSRSLFESTDIKQSLNSLL